MPPARPVLQRAQVILGWPRHEEDLDGDGQPDPLYVRDGRSMTLNLHVVHEDCKGRLHRAIRRGRVRLRNVQE